MCGICGLVASKVDKENLNNMTDAMYHRGPNAKGIYVAELGGKEIGLGHRRLSIFDVSEAANQPFFSSDGRFVVVYNGEIYNFKELRKELREFNFKTDCDTEVLLYSYLKWGKEALSKFNGMFAFSILDKENGKLVLGRDRVGVKPLYYAVQDERFYFASDLASLMADPEFKKVIDSEALHYYLWNMCIPSSHTIFKDTYKLEAGKFLEFNINTFQYKIEMWWDAYTFIDNEKEKLSEQESINLIERNLTDAVKLRLEADVPVGVFLSGGIDSSLVAAIASKIKPGNVDTFSIGFNEKEYDEAGYAAEVARSLGTRHHSLYCSIEDAKSLIKEIPKAYSEPFADNSQIPMMLLSKMTVDNVTVALSGDGGDELFLGYPHVINDKKLYENIRIAKAVNGIIKPIEKIVNGKLYSYNAWKINKLRNATSAFSISNLDYITAIPLIDSILKNNCEYNILYGMNQLKEKLNNSSTCERFIKANMLKDATIGLTDDMLTKVDRATMNYSLEARCPLLDYRVIEDSYKIPLDVKIKGNEYKNVLKQILYKYIPREIVDRPKQGFGIPINRWLHDKRFFGEFDRYFDSEYVKKQGIFDVEGITNLKKAFDSNQGPMLDRIIWTYTVFQMWWIEYMAD